MGLIFPVYNSSIKQFTKFLADNLQTFHHIVEFESVQNVRIFVTGSD